MANSTLSLGTHNVVVRLTFIDVSHVYIGFSYTPFPRSNDAPEDPEIQNLLDALLDPPGFGTKCMESDM